MIDDSDGDVFWILSLGMKGWAAIIMLLIAVVLWIIAATNRTECEGKQEDCPAGMTAKLMDHQCVCIMQLGDRP